MLRKKSIDFGDLRRLKPVSSVFGYDRGTPIRRFYIERFLTAYSADIRGHVLEIGDATYTLKFGGDKVSRSDVLHVSPGNLEATLVANLETGENLPRSTFDCIVLTQTLSCIFQAEAAVRNCYSALAPGGTVLATFPGIAQISRYDMDRWGEFWRFTSLSAMRLFKVAFSEENVQVYTYGNVLTAAAALYGLAAEELREQELDYSDADYEVIVAVRAEKAKD